MLRTGWLLLNLGAQALHMHIKGLSIPDIISAPNTVNKLTASEHTTGVAQQVFEQVEFFQWHRDRFTIDGNDVAFHVHAHAAAFKNLLFKFLKAAACAWTRSEEH